MSIPFFSPIYSSSDPTVQENCSFLRSATQFFDFGQKSYKITMQKGDQTGFELIEEDSQAPLWQTALRIAALFTLIIPLLMLIGLAIYRAANTFEIGPDRFKTLPDELYHEILTRSGFASIRFASTNKENQERVQNDPWYQRGCNAAKESIAAADAIENTTDKDKAKKLIRDSAASDLEKNPLKYGETLYRAIATKPIERALEIVKTMRWRDQLDALAYLAKGITDLPTSKTLMDYALDPTGFNLEHHLNESKSYINKTNRNLDDNDVLKMMAFASIVAFSDVASALKMLDFAQAAKDKDLMRLSIVEVIAKFDPEKAYGITALMKDGDERIKAETFVAMGFAATDPEKALKSCINLILGNQLSGRIPALKSVFAAIAKSNPEKALRMADALQDHIGEFLPMEKDQAFAAIAKVIQETDIEKALELVENILRSVKGKSEVLASIVKTLAPTDPARALSLARSIADPMYKSESLASIAFKY